MTLRSTFPAVHIAVLVSVLVGLSAICSRAVGQEEKQVFVLNSFNRGYPWSDNVLRGIDDVFRSSDLKVETYVTFMDMKRIPPTQQYFSQLKELIREGYKGVRFDAVLACDNDALEFMRKYRDELFPGLPVVFSSINDYDERMRDGRRDITGTSENTDYAGTIRVALKLRPATKTIVVVTDNTTTGKAHRSAVEKIRSDFPPRLVFIHVSLADLTMDELAQQLAKLDRNCVVLLLHHYVDRNGISYSVQQSTPLLTKSSAVPVFVLTDSRMGLGALGGVVVSGYHYGEASAKMVENILKGVDIRSIPVLLKSPNKELFDYSVMQRFKIAERDLPQGSIVINKPVSVLDQYRPQILAVLGVFLALCSLLFFLMHEIRNRRRSEERHRAILQTAMDGFWLVDTQGRLLEVNETYCRMSGYSARELLTMRIPDMEFVEAADGMAELSKKVMIQGEDRFESRHRRKDGSVFDVEISVQHQSTDQGGRLVAFLRDITARKHAEAEKATLEAQFQQAQKMESVGRLAGGVAHDFNNMLQVILGNTDMALGEIPPGSPLHENLQGIRYCAGRSADLTRQLMAFARRQTIDPKVLDLNETVESMLKMLRRLIGEDIALAWLPAEGLGPVKVDPSQVDQILANLCVNARDAIGGVGKVTIETANIVFDAAYCADHPGYVAGEYVRLAVSDNGCGMDKATVAQIFEPFFTTKGMGEGTGLGLATVYGIVKQNHGFINVYSEPGHGTTFTLYLPRHAGEAAATGTATAAEPPRSSGETVLLVEDEPAVLAIARIILERLGYAVLTAGTPSEAIRLAGAHAGEIHLLITDVVMPEMNGLDLERRLLSLHPKLKCLFMSGYTADVIAHHGVLKAGVNFIQKPFSMGDLAAKVRTTLGSVEA